MKGFVVVIQGQSNFVSQNRQIWGSYPHIFSTWEGSEDLYTPSDKVVFSKTLQDPGPDKYYLQQTTTLAGLKYAKELGYSHALKIRQDIFPTFPDRFVDLLDISKFNFLCWHAHLVHSKFRGYLVDYLMSGPIDDMITLWDSFYEYNVAELIITEAYENNYTPENINYFLPNLSIENDLHWVKNKLNLSTYQQFVGYKTTYESFRYEQ